MRGYPHDIWVCKGQPDSPKEWTLHNPSVGMANNSDDYYALYFESREEVEEFIKRLRNAAGKAWPNG